MAKLTGRGTRSALSLPEAQGSAIGSGVSPQLRQPVFLQQRARHAGRGTSFPAPGTCGHFGGDWVANVMWMRPAMRAASIT